jgi:hypothetical protein
MNIKTGLFGLGLLVAAGAVTVSCGGSDGDTDDSGGSSSTAGTSATAGSSNGGNGSGTAGSTNGTAGTTNNNGGNGNSTAGTTNNNGGNTNGGSTNNGGRDNSGGDTGFPTVDACDAAVMDGGDCMQGDDPGENAAGEVCACRRAGGQDRQWQCQDLSGGFGGEGPGGFGDATCPDNAMTGDTCEGTGLCDGQQCFCNDGDVMCFGQM